MLTLCFFAFNCKMSNRKSFSLSVEYYSPWTTPLKYYLTQNSITINGAKNVKNARIQNLYTRTLTKNESDSIYKLLRGLSYDTLKADYQNENWFDGTTVIFKIRGQGLKSKKVLVYMCSTAITDTLENLMQSKVFNNRFKIENFYKEE